MDTYKPKPENVAKNNEEGHDAAKQLLAEISTHFAEKGADAGKFSKDLSTAEAAQAAANILTQKGFKASSEGSKLVIDGYEEDFDVED